MLKLANCIWWVSSDIELCIWLFKLCCHFPSTSTEHELPLTSPFPLHLLSNHCSDIFIFFATTQLTTDPVLIALGYEEFAFSVLAQMCSSMLYTLLIIQVMPAHNLCFLQLSGLWDVQLLTLHWSVPCKLIQTSPSLEKR